MNMRNPYTIKPPRGALINQANSLSKGMTLCLLMNELTGNAVWDAVNKVSYEFDATYTPSWDVNGVKFDANRLHINGPALNDVLPAGCTSFTIFFKIKNLSGDPSSGRFYFYCGSYILAFSIDVTNIHFYIGASDLLNGYDADVLAGTTYCITVSGSAVALYKDGEVSAYSSSGVAIPTSTDTLEIGARSSSDNRYSNAIFECFYIFNRALNTQEVRSITANPYQVIQNPLSRRYYVSSSSTVSVNIESESDVTVDVYRQRHASPVIGSESSMSIETFRRRFAEAIIQSESDMSVSVFRRRFLSASIESESDLTMTAFRRRYLSMAIESESDIEASVYRRRYADLLIDSISDVIITLATETVSVIIESVSNVVVDAYRQRHASVEIASESEIEAEILRLVYASVEILSESDIEIDIEDIKLVGRAVLYAVTGSRNVLVAADDASRNVLADAPESRNVLFKVEDLN